jgi:glutaconate CoA-transferase, subunit A
VREKVMGLREAVALIRDGETLAIGGHTLRRHPMALIRELIRQGRRGLHLQGWNNGIDMDMLIGAGCAASVETSYIGISAFGLALNFRRACERDGLRVLEHSETTGLDMFRATVMGMSFFPTKTPLGTGLMGANPHLTEVACPFTGEPFAAVRAAQPDVAIIHAHTADRYGNVQLDAQRWNDQSADVLIAKAARSTIVSVEQIVSDEEIFRNAGLTVIPRKFVAAVVEAPYGAHPCTCDARYDYDLDEVRQYYEASKSTEAFEAYLEERVRGPIDHMAYLERIGMERLMQLTRTRVPR